MTDLAATQRWVQDAITDPDGLDAGLTRAAPRVLDAVAVVHGSAGLSGRERLGLYSRTYHQRLVGCLRDSYPGLRHALGGDLFDDFAAEYVGAQPSRSYTLNSLGAGWPAHLEATRPDRGLPPGERESWPDFLVDLARLERTFAEVYDGPGTEGDTLPRAADLPAWAELAAMPLVTAAVCVRLSVARFPVGDYLVAVRAGKDPSLPAPRPSFIAVSRRDYVVSLSELGPTGHAVFSALSAGLSLADAARRADVAPDEAWRLVGDWADRGLISAIDSRRPDRSEVQSARGMVR